MIVVARVAVELPQGAPRLGVEGMRRSSATFKPCDLESAPVKIDGAALKADKL